MQHVLRDGRREKKPVQSATDLRHVVVVADDDVVDVAAAATAIDTQHDGGALTDADSEDDGGTTADGELGEERRGRPCGDVRGPHCERHEATEGSAGGERRGGEGRGRERKGAE